MSGEQLHKVDLGLSEYAIGNIRSHAHIPEFLEDMGCTLSSPILSYIRAFDQDEAPPKLLLPEQDLLDLWQNYHGGPFQLDQPWIIYEPIHRRALDAVIEVRESMSREHAEEWSQLSAKLAKRLNSDCPLLSRGLEAVHEWTVALRRLLRLIGNQQWLPVPEGLYPTPSTFADPTCVPPVAELKALDPALENCVKDIRALFQKKPTAHQAKTFVICEQVNRNRQRTLEALRWLAKHGEYHGHSGRGDQQSDDASRS